MERKTAFVTGAAQGLGADIAKALFAAGHNVVIGDVNPSVTETAREIDRTGKHVMAVQFDVQDEQAFQQAFDTAIARFGTVEVMVNNAARTAMRSLWDISAEEWDSVLAINLRGQFFGCRIAGRHMRERGYGRIINMSSIAGQQASPATGAHYAASKAGILILTKAFATELAPHAITVNAVTPSAIMSPAVANAPPEKIAAVVATIPAGRLGQPEEVSSAVVYLASDAAGYITGATLDVNGGRLMR